MQPAARKQETLLFTDTEIKWVRRKWSIIREYHQKADQASAAYRRISDEINDYMDRGGTTDIVARARIRGESIPLADANGDGQWFRAEAQAHTDDLNLFIKLKEVGLL
jgi:hypothetical protein